MTNQLPDQSAPEWVGDRISDGEGWWLWLAVASYPDEAAALAEANNCSSENPHITGREMMRLRWADENDEDDAYLMEEWGVTTIAEPHPDGDREFWSIQMFEDRATPDEEGQSNG